MAADNDERRRVCWVFLTNYYFWVHVKQREAVGGGGWWWERNGQEVKNSFLADVCHQKQHCFFCFPPTAWKRSSRYKKQQIPVFVLRPFPTVHALFKPIAVCRVPGTACWFGVVVHHYYGARQLNVKRAVSHTVDSHLKWSILHCKKTKTNKNGWVQTSNNGHDDNNCIISYQEIRNMPPLGPKKCVDEDSGMLQEKYPWRCFTQSRFRSRRCCTISGELADDTANISFGKTLSQIDYKGKHSELTAMRTREKFSKFGRQKINLQSFAILSMKKRRARNLLRPKLLTKYIRRFSEKSYRTRSKLITFVGRKFYLYRWHIQIGKGKNVSERNWRVTVRWGTHQTE
jgi:hypothetical protein